MPSTRKYISPDGGWGWVIVASSFFIQSLVFGVIYTFGILFVNLLDVFDAGEFRTSLIGSLQYSTNYVTGMSEVHHERKELP